jgi:hypothetical protein
MQGKNIMHNYNEYMATYGKDIKYIIQCHSNINCD